MSTKTIKTNIPWIDLAITAGTFIADYIGKDTTESIPKPNVIIQVNSWIALRAVNGIVEEITLEGVYYDYVLNPMDFYYRLRAGDKLTITTILSRKDPLLKIIYNSIGIKLRKHK